MSVPGRAAVPAVVRWRAGRPTLALFHGFAGAPAAWDEVVGALGEAFSTVAPWLPGHDGFPGWFGGASFAEAVDALATALPALAPPPWHLVGYSLGGRLALALAACYQELVASAVLIGAHAGLSSTEARQERRRADGHWVRCLREEGLEAFVEKWEAQALFASQRRLPPARRAAQRAWRQRLSAEGLALCLARLGLAEMPDLWPALPTVRVPVLLVVGEEDSKFLTLAHAMAARLPAGRVEVVPGVGHNVVLEAPEALASLLVRHVAAGTAAGREVS